MLDNIVYSPFGHLDLAAASVMSYRLQTWRMTCMIGNISSVCGSLLSTCKSQRKRKSAS